MLPMIAAIYLTEEPPIACEPFVMKLNGTRSPDRGQLSYGHSNVATATM